MKKAKLILCIAIVCVAVVGIYFNTDKTTDSVNEVSVQDIPEYTGDPYVEINDNEPEFTKKDRERLSAHGYEYYSALDELGRCGYAESCVGEETAPEGEERESISDVEPSGWVQAEYDCVDGKYLYNRSHLIGWQLTGENANDHNLITGTRYFNVEGMLPFEDSVAEYVDYGYHIMYRVTPIFGEGELVCRGVQMEAECVEDDSFHFNVFVFNVQPGVGIDYKTGESRMEK